MLSRSDLSGPPVGAPGVFGVAAALANRVPLALKLWRSFLAWIVRSPLAFSADLAAFPRLSVNSSPALGPSTLIKPRSSTSR